jgi:hypothetical protein
MQTPLDRQTSQPPDGRALPGYVLWPILILVVAGTIGLGWRVLATRPTLIDYITMLLTLGGILFPAIKYRLQWHRLWQRLKVDLRWQIGLVVLTAILWAPLLWLLPGNLTDSSETYTVNGSCVLAVNFKSEEEAKEYLIHQAEQIARNHLGSSQPIGLQNPPKFKPGTALSEICIRATFRIIEARP